MTPDQKSIADNIVSYFKDINGIKTHIDAVKQRVETNQKSELSYVITILEEKSILKCADGHNRQIFYLMPDGWEYTSFDDLIKKEKAAKDKKSRKEDIDLSIAERIYKTYSSTRLMAIISCVVAIFLALQKLAEALKLWPYNK